MRQDELISAAYLEDQKWLHAQPKGYGGKGDKWAEKVREIAGAIGAGTVLDYGCGRGSLGRALKNDSFEFFEYDPAIKGKDKMPAPADLVVCTDVIEHLEEAKFVAVLDHIQELTRVALFAVIATVPAMKTLKDGRNAHILIRDSQFWLWQMRMRFDVIEEVPCRSHKEFAAIMSKPR